MTGTRHEVVRAVSSIIEKPQLTLVGRYVG